MTSKQMSLTRRITILYIVAISALAILSGTEQLLSLQIQAKQESDSRVINLAGRQRMLSQKLTKAALGLQMTANPAQTEKYLEEFKEAIAVLSETHEGLKLGNEALGLPGNNSSQVTLMFAEIEPHYQAMLAAAEEFLVNNANDRSSSIAQLLQHEDNFLVGMDEIVWQYDHEAIERVNKLKLISQLIFVLMLLLLLLLFLPIRKISKHINSLTSQMQESGIQVTSSTTDIAASGRQLEAMVAEQIASTNEVVATSKEISATSEELVRTMDEVATTSEETAVAANRGQKDLARMETTMVQLAAATTSIAGKLGAIGEKANNINSVVTTITQVADRTNLLSLNAAIEAEKAGEYGAGFAVVAREIRRLADQTAVATLDIEQMVKDMQGAVSSGVMEMDKFTKEVNLGVAEIRNIAGTVAEIITQVQNLTPRFQSVNQGMEVQSEGAGQITEAMIQLSEASQQTAESLADINRAVEQLNLAAQGLQEEIMNLN